MPLDFAREPAPRALQDYTAQRRDQQYHIWRSDAPPQFGLSCVSLTGAALKRWQDRFKGHRGIVWLRTKANCERVANEIAELQERDYVDPPIRPLR